MYNNLLYEIPESLGIHKHFRDINTFLKNLKDTENLSFSFENEETILTPINALRKLVSNSVIKKIINRHGINGITVPQDTFYCHSCCTEHSLINKTNKTISTVTGVLCTTCASYYYKTCCSCKNPFPTTEMKIYVNQFYCNKCFNSKYFSCVYCGHAFPLEAKFSIFYNNTEICYCPKHKMFCKSCVICNETVPSGQYSNQIINGISKPVCHNCQNNINKMKAFSPTDEQINKVNEELELKPAKGIFDEDEVEDYYEDEDAEYGDEEEEEDEI